jgi:predicted nucleic acid-binding protein
MVLVDTAIWVSHLKKGDADLKALLEDGEVLCHPFIIGELACGNLKNRAEILSLLQALPQAKVAEHDEVMEFIEIHHLSGAGLGYVDMHLLASALLSKSTLWTADRSLRAAAKKLEIGYE